VASELEARLGAPLFASRRNPVLPTELGRELADYGRTIRSATNSVSQIADRATIREFGELTIGATPFYSERIVSRFIAKRVAVNPEVRIILNVDFAPGMGSKLMDGTFDLIVGPVQVIEGAPNFFAEHVTDDHHVIVARAGHPILKEANITIEMLSRALWISFTRGSNLHHRTQQLLTEAGLKHINLPTFESTSAGAVRSVLRESDMLIVLPGILAAELVATGNFAILPFKLPMHYNPIGYVLHKDRQTPALKNFIGAWREELATLGEKAEQIRLDVFEGY
jgi:DNA-binding transcriptional LysR family regulator